MLLTLGLHVEMSSACTAMSVNNLANHLTEAGHRVEGLAVAHEAVDLRRELVALNRDAYLPDLATSVNNLAIDLSEAGRRVEGLAVAHEAVDLYTELAAREPGLWDQRLNRVSGLLYQLSESDVVSDGAVPTKVPMARRTRKRWFPSRWRSDP